MKKQIQSIILILCGCFFAACEDFYNTQNNPVTYGDSYLHIDLETDKAVYTPGETVRFTLQEIPGTQPTVRYSHLGSILHEEPLTSGTWSWTPPAEDFKGYLVDICETIAGTERIYHSIAVDVSSDWKKFPRYGFLSSYGDLTGSQIGQNIRTLNRHHINGIQFYDWMYDHHRPLAGTADNPLASWPDLIGRTNYLSTVQGYIGEARQRGMKALFYNLAFGALSNAASDGVREEWYLFKDAYHSEKDSHTLDAPFRSSIYLTNPANTEWQAYLAGRHQDVYQVFDFDGYHIDQLGNRGTLYDYDGQPVELDESYQGFITAMKEANPDKRLVMNAVSQYGQSYIAQAEVDFLYTEVWDESKTFGQLAEVITDNLAYSENSLNTVLAAYMNYARSNSAGYVNAPGILLTNAVIFSFGGAHLELGEHYLCNEYFPNSNLQMRTGLREALVHYYDFLVAYQNLLRDGGAFAPFTARSADGKLSPAQWPASQGEVAVCGKKMTGRDVVHLINFSNANTLEWRDTNGTQTEPVEITDAQISLSASGNVARVWMASPDFNQGVATPLAFTQTDNEVTLTLPALKYWDMIVLEY